MKISIITPSFNSGTTIEKAIQSVLAQNHADYEHIIVDGGSTDGTLDILKRYPHLKWVSEPDRGQVHAMNKGFSMATGSIIGYLNADDYYLEGAFSAVIPNFQKGAEMVMGKVLVCSEKPGGTHEWTCDPKTDFPSVLRHWELNAFCVNPVGYFYLRKVQEKIPLQEKNVAKHDLAFLIETALHFSIKKVDVVLGVFNHAQETQTGREQLMPSYWQPKNFEFVDRLAANLSEAEQKQFRLDRDRGYQLRRQWTAKEAFDRGMAQELFDKGEVFSMPEDEIDSARSRCGFVEHDRIGSEGDWIMPVLTMGKVGSQAVLYSLKQVSKKILPCETYHVHNLDLNPTKNVSTTIMTHAAVGKSLKELYKKKGDLLKWRFITGVRDPIATELSSQFQNHGDSIILSELYEKFGVSNWISNYFSNVYLKHFGINVYDYEFDHSRSYVIIKKNNIEILIYRLENLSQTFSEAMQEYIGVKDLKLQKINISSNKSYHKFYQKAKHTFCFTEEFLDKVYSTQFVKHFYTNEEIETFIKKWSRNKSASNITPNTSKKTRGMIQMTNTGTTDSNLTYQSAPGQRGGAYTENKLKKLKIPALNGKRFLDLGCNMGFYCDFAHNQGAEKVVGVDLDSKVINKARELHPDVEFFDTGWDIFPDGDFDIIICLSAIHYAKDPIELVENIRSHLARDGVFILEGGLIDADGKHKTDIAIPGWRKVGDRCRHLSRGFVEGHLLREFDWAIIGDSESRGGDPVPRYVIHATVGEACQEQNIFQLDLVEYAKCLALSAETIVPEMLSYEYIKQLGRCSKITSNDLSSILSSESNFAAFVDDLFFALGQRRPMHVKIHPTITASVLDPLVKILRQRGINVDLNIGCRSMSEYVSELRNMDNNLELGNLEGKVVADLATNDPNIHEAILRQGAKRCYIVGDRGCPIDDPRIVRVAGRPWDVEISSVDVAFFDARAVPDFDPAQDVFRLMEHMRRVLRPQGTLFAILQTSYVSPDFDVFNSIVLTPIGPLPSSPYLFDELLKNYAVRILDHPVKQMPMVTTRFLRLTDKKPTLLLIFGQSQSGKTSLARDFKSLDKNIHVSNDYIYTEIVQLKKMKQAHNIPAEIVEMIGDGGGKACGLFNRELEKNSNFLKKYLVLVESLIPKNKQLVTIDMDLRNVDQFDFVKSFFSEAGYSVWVVRR